jgi:hypothetical protein
MRESIAPAIIGTMGIRRIIGQREEFFALKRLSVKQSPPAGVSALLRAWSGGDESALTGLIPLAIRNFTGWPTRI